MTHEVIDETGRTLAVASPAYESIAGRPESIPASGATARGLDEDETRLPAGKREAAHCQLRR